MVVPVAAWSLTTALGVILFAAFVGGPERRSRTPGPLGVGSQASPAVNAAGARVAVTPALDPEADIPRWLRPTLQAQRRSGYAPAGTDAREPARFASPAAAGVDRRTIRYRLVRLSDVPDDIRSNEIGRLDRGDEVELIGEHDGFLRVRTPDGREGWLHRITIVG